MHVVIRVRQIADYLGADEFYPFLLKAVLGKKLLEVDKQG